jgi:hypothetical protein
MEEYGGDSRENCNASRKLDNFVPRQQEGGDGCLHSKFKASCKYARDITMSKSRWEGKLVEFLTKNATNWDPEVIPPEVAGRIFLRVNGGGESPPPAIHFIPIWPQNRPGGSVTIVHTKITWRYQTRSTRAGQEGFRRRKIGRHLKSLASGLTI